MASNDVTLTIGANLTPAQRQLQGFIVQAQRQLGSKSFAFKLDEKGFRQPLGRITGDLNQFQGAMDASIARTLAFGASVGAIAGVTKAFKDLVGVTIKVEHSLKEINVLLNLSTKDLKGFSKELFAVAKNTASSFDTVSVAATEFSRQGLSAAETAKRVNSALILTRLSGLDAEASVSALTAAVNGFKREAVTTTEVVNRLANVDAAFAVSSGDLAKALSRAGSVSQDAKVKFNELLAATTAVQQATARGGNVIGNGFKTIFTRLQRSKVRSELEKIGVATTDSMGNMRGAISILKDYAKVYQTLSDQQKAYTSEQVAGVFQINTLKALVNDLSNDYGVYNKALAVANATTNEAVKRNEELNKTLQSLASQTGTEIAELASKIGAISFESNFKGILGFIKSALGDVNKSIDSEGIGGTLARGVLKGFGDFISGPGLAVALVGITRLLYFIGKQTKAALNQVFQIGTASQKRQIVQQRINALLMEDGNLLKQIMSSSGNINDITAIVARNISAQNTALQRQKLLVDQIAAGFALTKAGSIAPIGGGARGPSGRGAFGRGAQGFVPNMVRSERSSISRGVGGARGGDRPVVIPNFNFGGGKTGTMVAHTGEHIIPNFARGGSAIFNRDMASSVGLPGGAVRVGAQGYVPNFAGPRSPPGGWKVAPLGQMPPISLDKLDKRGKAALGQIDSDGKWGTVTLGDFKYNAANYGTTAAAVRKKYPVGVAAARTGKKAPDRAQTLRIPADILGVAAALGMGVRDDESSQGASSLTKGGKKGARIVDRLTRGTLGAKADKFDTYLLKDIQVRSLQKASEGKFGQTQFKKEVAKYFSESLLNFGQGILGNIYDSQLTSDIVDKLKKQNPADLFTSATEGGIFESAIRVVTRGTQVSDEFSGEKNPFFDFEPGGPAQNKFIKAFKFNEGGGNLFKADAKRTANAENIRTLVSKSLADRQVLKKFLHDPSVREQMARLKRTNSPKVAAEGFIPSFANLASIAASPAGKRAMATERALAGSSRMGYDSRVGYGVFNNSQGSLSNAVSQHMNAGDSASSLASTGAAAQGVSAAQGYVPNFLGPGLAATTPAISKGIFAAFKKGTAWFNSKMPKALRRGAKGAGADMAEAAAVKGDRLMNKMFMASFALTQISGQLQSNMQDAEARAKAASVGATLTGAATGAQVGAMIPGAGAVGAGVGAVVGAIGGFVASMQGVEKAMLGIAKERLENMQEATKEQQAVAAYLEKLERVVGASTVNERVSAKDDLAAELANMDPAMASQVRALGENTDAVRNLIVEMKLDATAEDRAVELRGARESQRRAGDIQEGRALGLRRGRGSPRRLGGRGGRRKIEEQGAEARKTFTKEGRTISGKVDFTKVDAKKVAQLAFDLERITKLEFTGNQNLFDNMRPDRNRGEGIDPYQSSWEGAGFKGRDRTVRDILVKDLGMKTIPESLKGVLDKRLSELSKGYTGTDANVEFRQALEILAGLATATNKDREAWDEMAPKRAQETADAQAAALEKRLQAMSLGGPGAVLGKVVRDEQRNVAMKADTSKFQDQLGKFRTLLIGDDPDATKREKSERIAAVERKAIGRGEEVALDKQKVKFLGEIVKSIGKSDVADDQVTALNEIQTQLGLNQSAADILAQDNKKIQGEALDQLKDQVAATDAIKASATRQTKLLELNALRQAALLEETRRQKVKEAVQKGATTILSEGHDLRSAIDAIARYGDTVGKPLGGKLKGEEGTILALQARQKYLEGFSSPEYAKKGEKELLGRQESLFMQGMTQALGGNLRNDILSEGGVNNIDDFVQAAISKIELIGAGGDAGALDKLFEGTGINPEAREAQLRDLLDGLKNFSKTRGENEQRKAVEKLLAATEKAAAEQRDRAALTGADRMGINAQMGSASLTNQAKVQEARIEQTQKTIDDVLNMVEVGSDADVESMRYDLIAAIKQIPGLSGDYLEGMGEKGVPELLEDLQTWQTSQREHAGLIDSTLQEIIKNGENVKANTDALTTLTTVLAALKKTTVKELLGKDDNDPGAQPKARGFIPSMAGGGISDAMSRERRAISGGVGGAIPGVDRPRMITLNGGRAAVNTGESLVHNYRGTGQTAVFNRSMISRGGRPAGATPVVASGYVPNFAEPTPTPKAPPMNSPHFKLWLKMMSGEITPEKYNKLINPPLNARPMARPGRDFHRGMTFNEVRESAEGVRKHNLRRNCKWVVKKIGLGGLIGGLYTAGDIAHSMGDPFPWEEGGVIDQQSALPGGHGGSELWRDYMVSRYPGFPDDLYTPGEGYGDYDLPPGLNLSPEDIEGTFGPGHITPKPSRPRSPKNIEKMLGIFRSDGILSMDTGYWDCPPGGPRPGPPSGPRPGPPGGPGGGSGYASGYVPNKASGDRPSPPAGFFKRLRDGKMTPEDHAYLMLRDAWCKSTNKPDTPKPPLGIPYDTGPLPDDPEDWELGEHPYGKDLPDIPFVPNDPIQDLIDDFLNSIPEDDPKGLDPSQGYGEDYVPPPPTGKPPPVRPWGDIKPKPWVPPGGWPPAIQKELKEIEQYRKDNPIPGWVKGGGQGYGVGSAADMRAEQDIHRQHRDMKPVEGQIPGAPKPRKEKGGQGFGGGFDGKMLPGMQKHLDKIEKKNKKIKVPPHAIEAMEMGYGVNKPIPASVAETGPPRDWAAFGEKVSREDYVQKYRKWEKDQLEGKKKESLRESNVRDKAGRAQWRIWVERYNAQNSSGDRGPSGPSGRSGPSGVDECGPLVPPDDDLCDIMPELCMSGPPGGPRPGPPGGPYPGPPGPPGYGSGGPSRASGYIPNMAGGDSYEDWFAKLAADALQRNLDGRLALGLITRAEHARLSKLKTPKNILELDPDQWGIAIGNEYPNANAGYQKWGLPEIGLPPGSIMFPSGTGVRAYKDSQGQQGYQGCEGVFATNLSHEMGHWVSDTRGKFNGDVKTRKASVIERIRSLPENQQKLFSLQFHPKGGGSYSQLPEGQWYEEAVNFLIELWVHNGMKPTRHSRPKGGGGPHRGGARGSTGSSGPRGSSGALDGFSRFATSLAASTCGPSDGPRPGPSDDPRPGPSDGHGYGSGGPSFASGYIPNMAGGGISDAMSRERMAIAGGVGGAIEGVDRPQMINLNGRPAAVNTGESLVHNYKGTGETAVFNRSMISRGGRPAGATPVLSSGYIPNFAKPSKPGKKWWDKVVDFILPSHLQPDLGNLDDQDMLTEAYKDTIDQSLSGEQSSRGNPWSEPWDDTTDRKPPIRMNPNPQRPPPGYLEVDEVRAQNLIESHYDRGPISRGCQWVKGFGGGVIKGIGKGGLAGIATELGLNWWGPTMPDDSLIGSDFPSAAHPFFGIDKDGVKTPKDIKSILDLIEYITGTKTDLDPLMPVQDLWDLYKIPFGPGLDMNMDVLKALYESFGTQGKTQGTQRAPGRWICPPGGPGGPGGPRPGPPGGPGGGSGRGSGVASGYIPNFANGNGSGEGSGPGGGGIPGGFGFPSPDQGPASHGADLYPPEICDLFPELCTGVFGATASRPKPPSDITTKITQSMPAKVYSNYIATNPLTFGFSKFLDNSFNRGYPWQQDGKGYLKNWAPWPLTAPPNQIEPYVGIAMEEYLKLKAKIELWKEKWIGDESQTGPRGGIGPLIEKSIPGYKPGKYKASGYIPNFAGYGSGVPGPIGSGGPGFYPGIGKGGGGGKHSVPRRNPSPAAQRALQIFMGKDPDNPPDIEEQLRQLKEFNKQLEEDIKKQEEDEQKQWQEDWKKGIFPDWGDEVASSSSFASGNIPNFAGGGAGSVNNSSAFAAANAQAQKNRKKAEEELKKMRARQLGTQFGNRKTQFGNRPSQFENRSSQFENRSSQFGNRRSAFNNAEGYIPNLSLGSQMVPNMSASNHFLNFAEGSPAAPTSAPAPTSLVGGQTPGEVLITQAKTSQEKHNVNVNIEVYGNLSQDQVDKVQENGSNMATVLEELVNGGL